MNTAGDVTIGVGLVGYGASGAVLHAPLIDAEERLDLRTVVSSRRQQVQRDFPGLDVSATASELWENPAIELVVVAAPNSVHYELADAALRAGKHVVVDKPFVNRSSEADRLIRLAADVGKVLTVFHNRRWDSDFLTVERCVRGGALGRVSTFIARYDRFRLDLQGGWRDEASAGGGLLYDLGPHLIDQALRLFGMPMTVMADVGIQRPEGLADDYFHLVLGYPELRAILHAGSIVRARGPRFEVHGDRGSFVKHGMDTQVPGLLAGQRPGDPEWGKEPESQYGVLTTETAGMETVGRVASVRGAYETFYRDVARAVRGEGSVPVAAGEAADTIRVIECALEGCREGRTVSVG